MKKVIFYSKNMNLINNITIEYLKQNKNKKKIVEKEKFYFLY